MGWYVGLDAESAHTAFANTSFLIYDLAAAVICLLAVPVALATTMRWESRFSRRLLGLFALIGTGLLVIRSLASIVQAGYLIATGTLAIGIGSIWELWFYLGAILFTVTTWNFWRRQAE